VDAAEVEGLCEELDGLIKRGPRINADAWSRARAIVERFRSNRSGEAVHDHLVGLAYRFAQWFSAGKWDRLGDGGRVVKDDLHADIINLKVAIAIWRASQREAGA
jgi:hypothetical protein